MAVLRLTGLAQAVLVRRTDDGEICVGVPWVAIEDEEDDPNAIIHSPPATRDHRDV